MSGELLEGDFALALLCARVPRAADESFEKSMATISTLNRRAPIIRTPTLWKQPDSFRGFRQLVRCISSRKCRISATEAPVEPQRSRVGTASIPWWSTPRSSISVTLARTPNHRPRKSMGTFTISVLIRGFSKGDPPTPARPIGRNGLQWPPKGPKELPLGA